MIESESQLYQKLAEWTGAWIFYERIEPSNESGFPDVHFVVRKGYAKHDCEGTLELKYFKPRDKLDLSGSKVRGVQRAALMEYHQAGGTKRWFVAYHDGVVHIWPTHKAFLALQGREVHHHTFKVDDDIDILKFRRWFLEVLTVG